MLCNFSDAPCISSQTHSPVMMGSLSAKQPPGHGALIFSVMVLGRDTAREEEGSGVSGWKGLWMEESCWLAGPRSIILKAPEKTFKKPFKTLKPFKKGFFFVKMPFNTEKLF